MGRPAFTYTQKQFDHIQEGAKKGLNEAELAESIGISYKTFRRHKDQFSVYIKKGHDEGNDINIKDVENATLKAAKGYTYDEVTFIEKMVKDKNGDIVPEMTEITKKVIKKRVLVDRTLNMFYLVNRSVNWESINHSQDKGALEPDKMDQALQSMTGIMAMTHQGGERPNNGN